MQVAIAIVVAAFLGLSLAPLSAHETTDGESGQLGNVHFETSCNDDAQSHFDRGIAAVHNFFFAPARKSFNAALEKDPKCGIGYWGLAMTTLGNWLVSPPTPKVIADARAQLQKGFDIDAGT